MKKLTIKSIVEFKNKTDKSKKNFINALKLNKEDFSESRPDYWTTSLSAIGNSFKSNDLKPIVNKRIELEEKYGASEIKKVKSMYKRNIDILYNYESFDLKKWKPVRKLIFLKKHKEDLTLTIKGLEIKINPQYVFTFNNNEEEEIGAIWFIAKIGGFKKDELGMFTDILYRFLKKHYSGDYVINPKYCIAVDVFQCFEIGYTELKDGEVPQILNSTLDQINKMI